MDGDGDAEVRRKIDETLKKINFHEDELKKLHAELNELYNQVRSEGSLDRDPVIVRKPRDLSYYSAHRVLPKTPGKTSSMPRSATSNFSNLHSASMTNLKDIDSSDTYSLKSYKFSTIDMKFFKRFVRRSRALESDSEDFSRGSPDPSLEDFDRLAAPSEQVIPHFALPKWRERLQFHFICQAILM